MEFDRELFAARLRFVRNKAGMYQADLAAKLNLGSKVSISRYENALTEPSLEILFALSKLFGVTVDWLIGLSDSPQGEVRWISADTKPRKSKEYNAVPVIAALIGNDGKMHTDCLVVWDGRYWRYFLDGVPVDCMQRAKTTITHWQPLPKPPRKEKANANN